MVTINGRQFPGNSVEIIDGIVYIDGKVVDVDPNANLDISMESEGAAQDLQIAADDGRKNIKIKQKSKTGDNTSTISF